MSGDTTYHLPLKSVECANSFTLTDIEQVQNEKKLYTLP